MGKVIIAPGGYREVVAGLSGLSPRHTASSFYSSERYFSGKDLVKRLSPSPTLKEMDEFYSSQDKAVKENIPPLWDSPEEVAISHSWRVHTGRSWGCYFEMKKVYV